ncbi:MAG: hypothetical protein LBC06_01735 [Rickettsiales bacterium]|jgi:hypothetical protein|nr:hypothetical protein [Rickettsiales bacterium]
MITDVQEKLYFTKENLKQLQEENKQLKNIGVDQPPAINKKEVVEVETRPQNIMDWPVPIPNDKPEKLTDPLKPTQVNTELSDPSLTSVEDPEKSRQ